MAPVSGEERAEFLPPDPAFEDAVGASLGVVSLMRGSGANTYRAPGPLMIAPHALGRLHDRHGARTVDEALGALDALYRLLLTVPEAMAVRWGLERVLAEGGRGRTLLPGPRGGAWACTPLLLTVRGVEGRHLFIAVRSYLAAEMLDEAQAGEVAGVATEIAAAGEVMRAAHHVWFPGRPLPFDLVAANLAAEVAKMPAYKMPA
jgi:hypothetical protein